MSKEMTVAATTTAIQKPEAIRTVDQLLRSETFKKQVALALPKHLPVERFLRIVTTTIRRNPKLSACTVESLAQTILDSAQLGLELDGLLGRAYAVPYGDKCTLIIGYKGLIALAYRSRQVKAIQAAVVYDRDKFHWQMGLNPDMTHEPYQGIDHPGKVTHSYCVATLDGDVTVWVVLPRWEIEEHRKRSKSANTGPWQTDYAAMAKKTAIRVLSAVLPIASESPLPTVQEAVAIEDTSHIDAGAYVDVEPLKAVSDSARPAFSHAEPVEEPEPLADPGITGGYVESVIARAKAAGANDAVIKAARLQACADTGATVAPLADLSPATLARLAAILEEMIVG